MNKSIFKLSPENWAEISQKQFHLNFLNERNAIRSVLYDLLQIDNEIKCTNVEIQNLKTAFDKQLNCLETEVKRLQDDETLEQDEQNKLITKHVKEIENANLEFSKKIEQFQLSKEKSCKAVNENVEKLFQLKSQFKMTHEMQVESLKRFRVVCDRGVRPQVDVRLKSIDRKFCDELFYIDSCEKDLKHIFSLIEDKSSESGGIGSTCSSCSMNSKNYSEFLMDFAWMRNEQISKRSELFEYFKKHVAKDLVAALAAMHMYQPEEPIKFLATFLKQLKQNEFRQRIQELIFNAAKNGESLFPINKTM
ncbi:uncharacterized protein LOC129915867 [Episyrphus balteatus]|uniref:uncharacterized protein LOC129915867 n=1 Tax=Episyrphus balteatus TaxID=286459 RepID=UPI0024865AE9|nr:uncharacterized protein LOC129915867 [Episyrphus balteatus]